MKKSRTCIYFGKSADSGDHVPPKLLFPKLEKYKKFRKIPSCSQCNQGFSLDEEYFRLISSITSHRSKIADELFNSKVKRSMQERSALGLSLLRKMKVIDIVSDGGIYLEKNSN